LRVLLKSLACPVFVSGETATLTSASALELAERRARKRADALRDRTEEISSSRLRIGEIDFHPFTIPHDAVDNFGFVATHAGVRVATLMDFGHVTTLIAERLRGCAAVVIESNHSRDMLKACDVYPWELKQRILSRTGHLSNEDVAEWLRSGFDGAAEHVVLAHLSQRANNPYVAKLSAEIALQERGTLFSTTTQIMLSHPKEPTPWVEL
jgi:phosphoribosyl 1,2-cyclic phosphodiesterase